MKNNGIEHAPEKYPDYMLAQNRVPGYEDLPLHLQPREYGRSMLEELPFDSLVMVTQTRKDRNKSFSNLLHSIETTRLQSPPIIARMPPDNFNEYVAFVNRIWDVPEEEQQEYTPSEDGYYYLVVAGHTRILAVGTLEMQRQAEVYSAGYDQIIHSTIWCHIMESPSSEEILTTQMDENIHDKVPEEQSAVAIVESYYYGIETGQWSTEEEFTAHADGKFTPKQLSKALAFSRLPKEFRDIVVTNGVPYVLGIEVAQIGEEFLDYILRKYHDGAALGELPEEMREKVLSDQKAWMGSELIDLQLKGKRVNIGAYRKRTASLREAWAEKPEEDEGSHEQGMMFGDIFAKTQLEEYRREHMRRLNEYRAAVKALNESTNETAAIAVGAHMRSMQALGLEQDVDELIESIKDRERKFAGDVLGRMASRGAQSVFGFPEEEPNKSDKEPAS